MKQASEAPVWYGAEQADAWADGYNSAVEGCSPVPDPYRDTVKKLAAVREKRLAELAEENAQLRTELAKKRPEIFFGTIAEVYGDLDAEDCAMLDREWARWRGYILPTNGTSTLLRPAPQPSSCLNCGDPSHEPFCGTCREMGCAGEKPSLPLKNGHAAEAQASAPSLREALRPFAAVAAVDIGSDEADGDMFSSINHHNAPRLTVGDFRRALAALLAPAEPRAAPELTATCTKLLPGGVIDDSTYSQIEDALDAINAPMTGDGGRYLTISERIAASGRLKSATEKALNYIENTDSELGIKLSCGDALREALTSKGEGNK